MEVDIIIVINVLTPEAAGIMASLNPTYICLDQGEATLLHSPNLHHLVLCCDK